MRVTPFVFAGLVAARAVIPRGADVQSKEIESSHSSSTPIATPATTVVGKPVSQPEPSTTAVLVKGGPPTGNGTVPGGGIHPAGADTTSTPIAIGTIMPKPQQPPVGAQNGTVPAPSGNPVGSHGNSTQPTGPPHYQAPQGSPSQSPDSPAHPVGTPTPPNNGAPSQPEIPSPHGSPSPMPPSNGVPSQPQVPSPHGSPSPMPPSNGAPSQPQVPSPHGSPAPVNGTVVAPGSAQPSDVAGAPKAGQSCPVDGALVCNGPDFFALCNFGKIDLWLHVAAGTACRDGKIDFA